MYSGKQALRLEKFKASDIGGLDKELKERKGSGKYDSTRTPYNIELINYDGPTLASSTYDYLYSNNINYNPNKKSTKVLNGLIITSGQEFFEHYGMEFKDTGEVYKTGDNAGQPIRHVVIDENHKLSTEIKRFFDESLNFISDFVGKENIRYAAIHLDESTPHMHIYFTPVVNEVKRKVFELDENGHQLKHEITNKKGEKKLVPIQKKDENGNNIYETVKGKFLNNDQFWKDLGGRNSFSKLQDRFNKYITSKGFNLDRGEIGANKYHQTKLEYHINELKAEEKKLNKDLNNYKDKINEAKNILETSLKDTNSDLKKKIIGYSKKEVEKLMDDFDNLTRLNTIKTYESKDKDDKITSLSIENDFYKNNKQLIKSEKIRHEQSKELSNKDAELKYYKNAFSKLSCALDIITKRRPMPYVHNYISFAESVMSGKRTRETDE